MISIVCVYNNKKMLHDVLLKGLEHQNTQFELITLDNREGRFKSATEALNFGGEKATGNYIMFAHQDMWFINHTWLEDAERTLQTIQELGVAGVAGASEIGSTWTERCRHSISVFDEGWSIPPVEGVEEVQTLDECALIVPQSVFSKVKFDEEIFDGWDCYGADYCLAVKQQGGKSYVIPGESRHCCLRENTRPWEFKGLFKYQKRLYQKHKHKHKIIYAWMGKLTWWTLRYNDLLTLIGPIYLKLFPGNDALLANELRECKSILDLGCGYQSPIYPLKIPFSVGAELSEPHVQESKRLGVHSEYIITDIRTIEFKANSFDAVVALNVIEHLSKEEGLDLIKKMEQWATKKIVIRTLNRQSKDKTDDNDKEAEACKSTWESHDLDKAGFKVRGTDGWRWLLRLEHSHLRMLLTALTQRIVFYFPKQAVGLIASKTISAD